MKILSIRLLYHSFINSSTITKRMLKMMFVAIYLQLRGKWSANISCRVLSKFVDANITGVPFMPATLFCIPSESTFCSNFQTMPKIILERDLFCLMYSYRSFDSRAGGTQGIGFDSSIPDSMFLFLKFLNVKKIPEKGPPQNLLQLASLIFEARIRKHSNDAMQESWNSFIGCLLPLFISNEYTHVSCSRIQL